MLRRNKMASSENEDAVPVLPITPEAQGLY